MSVDIHTCELLTYLVTNNEQPHLTHPPSPSSNNLHNNNNPRKILTRFLRGERLLLRKMGIPMSPLLVLFGRTRRGDFWFKFLGLSFRFSSPSSLDGKRLVHLLRQLSLIPIQLLSIQLKHVLKRTEEEREDANLFSLMVMLPDRLGFNFDEFHLLVQT